MAMEKLGINIAELAALLGIGRNKAYELTRLENFPCIRLGNRVVILVDGLRAWLDEQAQPDK